jgi:hypothetical protein
VFMNEVLWSSAIRNDETIEATLLPKNSLQKRL